MLVDVDSGTLYGVVDLVLQGLRKRILLFLRAVQLSLDGGQDIESA